MTSARASSKSSPDKTAQIYAIQDQQHNDTNSFFNFIYLSVSILTVVIARASFLLSQTLSQTLSLSPILTLSLSVSLIITLSLSLSPILSLFLIIKMIKQHNHNKII